MSNSTINIDLAGDVLEVWGDYSEGFISDLERGVPAADRSWSSEDKVWSVAQEHYEMVKDLCYKHFKAVNDYAS